MPYNTSTESLLFSHTPTLRLWVCVFLCLGVMRFEAFARNARPEVQAYRLADGESNQGRRVLRSGSLETRATDQDAPHGKHHRLGRVVF